MKQWSSARLGSPGAGVLPARRSRPRPPQPETGCGLPRDVSVDGHRIDWLIKVTDVVHRHPLRDHVRLDGAGACFKHNEKHDAEYDHGELGAAR